MHPISQRTVLSHLDLKKFQVATDKSSDNILITDSNGIILYLNESTKKNTGYTVEDLLGKTIGVPGLWGGLMSDEYRRDIWKTIKIKKRPFRGEVANKRKNGSRYIGKINIFPIINELDDVEYFVSIEKDVTKKHDIERTKNDFVALASHQLRTPLTSIWLSIELFLKDYQNKLNAEQESSLKGIYDEVLDMAELVETLLNVSKIQLGDFVVEPKPTKLQDIFKIISEKFDMFLKSRDLRLVTSFDQSVRPIMTDQNVIKVVLENLLSNAIKYSHRGSSIVVEVKKRKNKLIVSIKDTGLGIPEEYQEKIFDKFYRAPNVTRKEAQGTGMGLYLTKLLLKAIGGKIWFDSKENKGTDVYISLPLKKN